MTKRVPITVARGDGIGPEIMDACLHVLTEAGARLAPELIEIGEAVYQRGVSAGIEPSAWESLRRTKVFYKAPITTPQGGGFKSLNVTVRKALGHFANVRPCTSYHPFVRTKHPGMDLVIVRENEEDLYAGIEHRQTRDVTQCLKLITRPGSERLIRYAFEWARAHGRKKVTALTKDNIMKLTDGLFRARFEAIAAEYPELETDHLIVDIGAARVADTPEAFDVIVLPNLYGDILSDVAAQIAGSVGLAGSANVGEHGAMFEAIHGSAPRLAGQDVANPSGLLLAGVMMLVHIGQPEIAERVHNAWLRTLEDGVHTPDMCSSERSARKVGTREFAKAIVARLGDVPSGLPAVSYAALPAVRIPSAPASTTETKVLVGYDVFLDAGRVSPNELAARVAPLAPEGTELTMITNRGVKVWPDGIPETFCVDHWRLRFKPRRGHTFRHADLVALLARMSEAGLDFVKTEGLYDFDGKPGYSLGQGQ